MTIVGTKLGGSNAESVDTDVLGRSVELDTDVEGKSVDVLGTGCVVGTSLWDTDAVFDIVTGEDSGDASFVA